MNTTSELTSQLRQILEMPRAVVDVVDELLKLCREESLELEMRRDRLLIRYLSQGAEEEIAISLPRPVFRAILARIAARATNRSDGSHSPYVCRGQIREDGALIEVEVNNSREIEETGQDLAMRMRRIS